MIDNLQKIEKLEKQGKKYFWHELKLALVWLRHAVKNFGKWLNVHTKKKLVHWAQRIDRLDGTIGEDSLMVDILQYYAKKLLDFKAHWRGLKQMAKDIYQFVRPPVGSLSWRRIFKISSRNLIQGRARVWVTMGAVSVGIGAIVLLVSFGFGLEQVVTSRIIWPEALKVAEVTSETNSVKLTKDLMEKIAAIDKVIKIAPSIRSAGQVDYNGSKIDVVLVGVGNDYFKLSDLKIRHGGQFSLGSDVKFIGEATLPSNEKKGEVAGISSEPRINYGDLVSAEKITFRLRDEVYVPVFANPKSTARTLGYARGSILETLTGKWVWGGIYEDISGQGRVLNPDGILMGKWLKANFPLYEDLGGGLYREKQGESGQEVALGYVNNRDVQVLSEVEIRVQKMLDSEGEVLGEATASANIEAVKVGTESAGLLRQLNKSAEIKPEESKTVVIKVRQDNAKEILISSSLVKAWNKKDEDILGKEVNLEFLLTSSLVPGLNNRILSEKTKYKIVGIFEDNSKPMAFVPLGDMESLGVKNYSSVKVLAEDELALPGVRTLIQSMGLVTRSVADTLSQIVKLFAIIRFLLGSFGAIALMVALFGMFNTLTVSLLERTREIGVMKSLGTTNSDVTRIFLTESMLISAVGGIGGVFLGSILGRIADATFFAAVHSTEQSIFIMPFSFGIFIFLLAILVGIVTGWYPAMRASKISALNALRYE